MTIPSLSALVTTSGRRRWHLPTRRRRERAAVLARNLNLACSGTAVPLALVENEPMLLHLAVEDLCWRLELGRLVTHHHVDVMVAMAAPIDRGPHGAPYVVADADLHDIADISAELMNAKSRPAGGIERFFELRPALARVPGLLRAMYAAQDRSIRLRQRIGTVAITTAGMSHVGETFGLTSPALTPLHVTIGSSCAAPRQTGNFIERHEILNLTLTFDRDVVGEGEAAQFATRLCHMIEGAEVLQSQMSKRSAARLTVRAAGPAAAAQGVDAAR